MTCRFGASLSASGMVVAPERITSSWVITKIEAGARLSDSAVLVTDETSIVDRSSIDMC